MSFCDITVDSPLVIDVEDTVSLQKPGAGTVHNDPNNQDRTNSTCQ